MIHVETEGEPVANPAALLEALHLSPDSYHSFREDDIAKGIKHYVEQNKFDLVMVLPHRHSLLERMFAKGHTAGILQSMPVPVMALPATA